jgi:CRISPR/Cas system endoribonuclease Cas6 (RAMP superfamily)
MKKAILLDQQNPDSTPSESTIYSLHSVVVHHGNSSGGHYTCYRKNTFIDETTQLHVLPSIHEHELESDTWLHISDESVYEVSVQEVLSANAYLLFYQQCSKEPIKQKVKKPVRKMKTKSKTESISTTESTESSISASPSPCEQEKSISPD